MINIHNTRHYTTYIIYQPLAIVKTELDYFRTFFHYDNTQVFSGKYMGHRFLKNYNMPETQLLRHFYDTFLKITKNPIHIRHKR